MRIVTIRILSEESPVPSADAGSSEKTKSKTKEPEKSATQIMAVYAARRTWEFVKREAVYYANKYIAATEDYKLQVNVQNATDTIDSAMNIGTAMLLGAKMGGAPGMVVAGTLTAAGQAVTKLNQFQDYSQKIVENAYGNYFYGTRAGLVTGGHGTEN